MNKVLYRAGENGGIVPDGRHVKVIALGNDHFDVSLV
jgi:hypothetical protein